MRLKRSIEKYFVHGWNVFSDNLILFVPVLGVGIVSMMVYAGLGAVLFFACIRDFISLGYNFHDPSNLPWHSIGSYFSNFVFYIVAVFSIAFAFSFAVSIIHRAGIGFMLSQAVKNGRTYLGEYFEGVARYSGRMFNMLVIRTSILLIPIMLLLLIAIIVAKAGSGGSAGGALLFVFGMFGVMFFEFVAMFMMWMWMPAVFVKDSSVMEGLSESLSFTMPRISNLLLFGIMWVIITSIVSGFFEIFITMFNALSKGGHSSTGALAGMMVFMLTMVRWSIITVMRVFFSVFYYKFYHDETSPDVPYEAPRQSAYQPPQGYYYTRRNPGAGPIPQQYNVNYPQQPYNPAYNQQQGHPHQNYMPPQQQPATPQPQHPMNAYQPPTANDEEVVYDPIEVEDTTGVENVVDDAPGAQDAPDANDAPDAIDENTKREGEDDQLPPGFC